MANVITKFIHSSFGNCFINPSFTSFNTKNNGYSKSTDIDVLLLKFILTKFDILRGLLLSSNILFLLILKFMIIVNEYPIVICSLKSRIKRPLPLQEK